MQSSILSSATRRSDEPRAEAGESRRQRSRLQAARLCWTWPLKQNKQGPGQPSRAALYERAVREAVLAGTHPSGQRPLCVFLWFLLMVPDTVLDAWYATALDTEDIVTGAHERQAHIFVADVIASFDTVDRGFLDGASGRFGLPSWFRRVYFSYHARVKLRFKLAAGLGEPWTWDGGIPQGCPLSMVFTVALYVLWCRYQADQAGFPSNFMLIRAAQNSSETKKNSLALMIF